MSITQNLTGDFFAKTRIHIFTELALHVYILYSLTSVNFQFYVPYIALIMMLFSAFLSGLIGLESWRKSATFYLILITSVIYVAIQVFIFQLEISNGYVQPFLYWLVLAVIIFPFAKDEGFLKRLAVVIAFAFLIQIPFLTQTIGTSATRLRFIGGTTGVDNANDLAAWLGFSFVVMWMWLWNIRPRLLMLILLALAGGVLTLLLSTVSRGALLGVIIAVFVYIRAIKKKRRVLYLGGLLAVAITIWIIPYTRGVLFDYQARLFEDTGRGTLLNLGWNALKVAPFWGYGADNVYFRLSMETIVGPHNPFLLIGLSSGFIPLFSFCLLWLSVLIQLIRGKFAIGAQLDGLTLFVYTTFVCFLSNSMFTSLWVISVLYFVSQSPLRQVFKGKSEETSQVPQNMTI